MKLLRFQRTFLEKSFVSGFEADSPDVRRTQKTRRNPRFYFFVICWNCVPNLLFLPFFRRKVSQRTSHRICQFILAKLLKFQETFREKFLVSGFGAEAPTDNAHTKSTASPRFLNFYISQLSACSDSRNKLLS